MQMKTKFKLLSFVLALTFVSAPATFADDAGMAMIADVAVVRPVCFVATAIGSTFFVLSLPIAAMSHSTKKAAHVLVVNPARATFTRPLGDMDALMDY